MAYLSCYLCELLHNDGALIECEGKKYNVCMDCSEKEDVNDLVKAKKEWEDLVKRVDNIKSGKSILKEHDLIDVDMED